MRYVELRRHTDSDGDELTAQGVADAEVIGREGLQPPYAAFISSGAVRATQMVTILRHAAGQDGTPISEATGLRSSVEDRWRAAAKAAGRRHHGQQIRGCDPAWSSRRSGSSAQSCEGSSTRFFPRAAGLWLSDTVRRTRLQWQA